MAAVVASLGLIGILVALLGGPDGPRRPVFLIPLVGIVVLVVVVGLRQRGVCVIEPARVGHGNLGGRMFWIDRNRIGSVRVRQSILLQVLFYDHDGRLFASTTFNNFSPAELREAFQSAGIPVQ